MILGKWLNKQKLDKDKRRPVPGRRYPVKSYLLVVFDITPHKANYNC
ncbi:hypothetical protein LCGC14_0190800 [marine sediment metagenome]|uniref:Uncharacterized protein n=1 Tax=marine sediment metagenome TaxID=412755 RepID=A0A0F9UQU4_9ZZZZ